MIYYASAYFLWFLGVLFSVAVSALDDRFASRRSGADALREALVWPLVWIPWREWLRRGSAGRHRRRAVA